MRSYFVLLFIVFFSCKKQSQTTESVASPVVTIPVVADTAMGWDLSVEHADDYIVIYIATGC